MSMRSGRTIRQKYTQDDDKNYPPIPKENTDSHVIFKESEFSRIMLLSFIGKNSNKVIPFMEGC